MRSRARRGEGARGGRSAETPRCWRGRVVQRACSRYGVVTLRANRRVNVRVGHIFILRILLSELRAAHPALRLSGGASANRSPWRPRQVAILHSLLRARNHPVVARGGLIQQVAVLRLHPVLNRAYLVFFLLRPLLCPRLQRAVVAFVGAPAVSLRLMVVALLDEGRELVVARARRAIRRLSKPYVALLKPRDAELPRLTDALLPLRLCRFVVARALAERAGLKRSHSRFRVHGLHVSGGRNVGQLPRRLVEILPALLRRVLRVNHVNGREVRRR